MTGPQPQQNYPGFRVYYGLAPMEGPLSVPIDFDFTLQASYNVDLRGEVDNSIIPWVEGIYIDNSLNAGALSITFNVTNQTLKMPAFSQGYLPCLCPNSPSFTATLTAPAGGTNSNTNTAIQLLSMPVPAAVWSVFQGQYPATTLNAPSFAYKNFTTGGVAIVAAGTTQLFPASGNLLNTRNYLTGLQLYNTGAAGTEIQVLDGAAIIWDGYLGGANGAAPGILQIADFETPLRGSIATAMSLRVVTGITISILGSAQGFIGS